MHLGGKKDNVTNCRFCVCIFKNCTNESSIVLLFFSVLKAGKMTLKQYIRLLSFIACVEQEAGTDMSDHNQGLFGQLWHGG